LLAISNTLFADDELGISSGVEVDLAFENTLFSNPQFHNETDEPIVVAANLLEILEIIDFIGSRKNKRGKGKPQSEEEEKKEREKRLALEEARKNSITDFIHHGVTFMVIPRFYMGSKLGSSKGLRGSGKGLRLELYFWPGKDSAIYLSAYQSDKAKMIVDTIENISSSNNSKTVALNVGFQVKGFRAGVGFVDVRYTDPTIQNRYLAKKHDSSVVYELGYSARYYMKKKRAYVGLGAMYQNWADSPGGHGRYLFAELGIKI